ncbi:hypothetical protein F2P79_015340 [Pimephales promelas]|nr:hypothetical protein F2P79_015340 [Pimephales promelas]
MALPSQRHGEGEMGRLITAKKLPAFCSAWHGCKACQKLITVRKPPQQGCFELPGHDFTCSVGPLHRQMVSLTQAVPCSVTYQIRSVDTQAWLFGRGRNPAKVTGHLMPPTDFMSHHALISIVNFRGRKRDDTQSDSLCRT